VVRPSGSTGGASAVFAGGADGSSGFCRRAATDDAAESAKRSEKSTTLPNRTVKIEYRAKPIAASIFAQVEA
jgi:hypothetical protein